MKIHRIALSITAACILAVAAFAQGGAPAPRPQGQQGPRGGRMMGMGGMMLMSSELQKELKITAAQKSSLEKIMKEMRAQPRDKVTRESMQKYQTRMMGVLSASQKARLKQIELQARGGSALLDPDIQKQLGITAAQKSKLKALQDKFRKENMAKFEAARKANKPMDFSAMQKQRKAEDAKLMAVLSQAQKAKWKAMTGKPFDMPMRGPRR